MRSYRVSEKVSIDKEWHQGRYLEFQENSELESDVDQIEHDDTKRTSMCQKFDHETHTNQI